MYLQKKKQYRDTLPAHNTQMFPCALDVAISPAVDVVFPAAALAVVTSGVVVVFVVVVLHGKSTHSIVSFFARLLFGSLFLTSLATYSNRSISLLTKTPECSMAMLENHKHSFAELSLILDT